jgi:hypothetical protein
VIALRRPARCSEEASSTEDPLRCFKYGIWWMAHGAERTNTGTHEAVSSLIRDVEDASP